MRSPQEKRGLGIRNFEATAKAYREGGDEGLLAKMKELGLLPEEFQPEAAALPSSGSGEPEKPQEPGT